MLTKNKLKTINECRRIRRKGVSFGEISSITEIPKTTVYSYTKDISLSKKKREKIENRRKELARRKPNFRKGKCIQGRNILKPNSWDLDLVHIVSHFMFDGCVRRCTCAYYSKDEYQIIHMKELGQKVFKVKSTVRKRKK